MANPTVVNSAQTAGTQTASLSITTPTAGTGRYLICMVAQSGSTTAPTISGWTQLGSPVNYQTGASCVTAFYKLTAGSETSIAPTPASGGAIQGVCYWELSGVGQPIAQDGSGASVANGNAATATFTLSTTNPGAGEIVLLGIGQNAQSSGTTGWNTGTLTATQISSATSRMFGASYVSTSAISGTIIPVWSASHAFGGLAVVVEGAQAFTGSASGSLSLTGAAGGTPKVTTPTLGASLTIVGAATTLTWASDLDAVPGIASFPFIPGLPEQQLTATAPVFLTVAAGTITGTPAIAGTGMGGSLSLTGGSVTPAPATGLSGTLNVVSGTITGKPGFSTPLNGASLTVTSNTVSGTPSVNAGAIGASLSISTNQPTAYVGGQGLLAVSANTVTGSPNFPAGSISATLSIVSSASQQPPSPQGVTLALQAGPITGTPNLTDSTLHSILTVGGAVTSINAVGGTLTISGFVNNQPQARAFLTITAGTSGVAYSPAPVATFLAPGRNTQFYAVAEQGST